MITTSVMPGVLDNGLPNNGGFCMSLKVMGICWVAAVAGIPILGQITPADAGEKLMTGSVQVVLAVVVLGLSGAIVWTVRKLLKAHEDRVVEAKENAKDQVAQANCHTAEMTKALSDNSTALSQNATSNQQLKESVFHLSEVIDRKLDKN